jgi:predicted RNase H-like HicB family nuclease
MTMYKIEIFYSEEDEGYIAIAPELPGCSAFGETEEAALEEIKIAQELWLETAAHEGRVIPEPENMPRHQPKDAQSRRTYNTITSLDTVKRRKQNHLQLNYC